MGSLHIWFGGWLAGTCLMIAITAQGQSVSTLGDGDIHWRSAWGLLQLAEMSNSAPQDSKSNLNKAMAECDAALKIQPDFFRTAALAAHCAYRLAQLENDSHLRDDDLRAARARFEVAAHCTGAEASLFREWGGMLIFESGLRKDARDRLVVLQEARQVYESGIHAANYSGERAKLERDLGTCLVLLAPYASGGAERLTLYDESIRHFQATTNVDTVGNSPQVCAHWGIALVESGKLTHNYQKLREAIERLGTALEGDPKNLEARYSLVCAYALLDEPGKAMRHLQICLENDNSKQTYYNLAAHDPDLDSLRSTAEYNASFGEKPRATVPAITPKISN
jgi:tetratricopeptide (TPR) repeat protein